MNQAIRIISFIKRIKDSNLRYKIVYRRTVYSGYNIQTGDELDHAIYNYLNQLNPTTISWEYIGVDTEFLNLRHILNTFTSRNIPLIITPCLDNLSAMELDNLQINRTEFKIQNCQITMFYRYNMDENHINWMWLPTDVRIDINYKSNIHLSQTIFTFQ